MKEQHRLHLNDRDDPSKSNGACSCGLWSMHNRPSKDIREAHAEHVQQFLGPDAVRLREENVA
jgi:hypothetical protein